MASNITCPVPSTINPLTSSGFMFSIQKIPEVSFFCQEVSIPSVNLPSINFNTPLSTIYVPGDLVEYDDLVVQFIVDENMSNYSAIVDWIVALGFPGNHEQYAEYIAAQTGYTRLSKESSNATLEVLGPNNNPIKTIKFVDVIPTNISGITFQSTVSDVTYIVGTAVFKISRYEFVN